MNGFVAHWIVTALALVAADWMLDGVRVGSGIALAVGALVLGLVNAVVRPALTLLTFPLTVVTFGLFLLVVNGVAFAVAAALVPGFGVESLGSAIAGAVVVSLVSWFVGSFLKQNDARR